MALFGSNILFDFSVVVAFIVVSVYVYLVRKRNQWAKKGIPVDNASILLGHMKDAFVHNKSLHDIVRDLYFQNKRKPFVTFFAFTQPIVIVNDLEMVKKILIKDFQFFPDHNFEASAKDPMQYYNVFQVRGEFWKKLRIKLSPTFTSGKMKKMFQILDACGKAFAGYLERERDQRGDIEIKDASGRFTSDVITNIAFGIEGDALQREDSSFCRIMREHFTFGPLDGFIFFMAFLYPWLVRTFGLVTTKKKVADFCRATVWQTIEYREKNNVKRNDFLDLMMQLRKNGRLDDDDDDDEEEEEEDINAKKNGNTSKGVDQDNFAFDGDVLVAQCFIFMGAGFETSSTTMSWALYEMALQPDIQQSAYDEITEVLEKHGGKVTYEAVQEMTYLNQLVLETLRKYPVLSFLDRRVVQPYKLPGTDIVLERGQGIMIPILGIHWDPEIYPEPERFDPERFSIENSQKRPPCSFLGFGEGPRICIGMRLGLLQSKIGLMYLLRNFVATPCEKTPMKMEYDKNSFIITSKGGITLRLKKRDL